MCRILGANVTCYRETLVRLSSLNVTIKIIKYVIMGNVQVNGNKPLLCLGSPQLYSPLSYTWSMYARRCITTSPDIVILSSRNTRNTLLHNIATCRKCWSTGGQYLITREMTSHLERFRRESWFVVQQGSVGYNW